MTENEALEIAIHCLGVQAEEEVCEECPVYLESGIACRDAARTAITALREIQRYRTIGTVEECREAVEKQEAKNPSVHKQQYSDAYNCSKCGWTFIHKDETGWFCGQHYKFCPNCGQAISWV